MLERTAGVRTIEPIFKGRTGSTIETGAGVNGESTRTPPR
jgi:hypothetical protein